MDDVKSLRLVAERRIGVPAPLHEYQWEGVSFLFRSAGALLADEMGLGKTVQASVALALLLETRSDVDRALVVAPASLTLNWMEELSVWAPTVAARRLEGGADDRDALYSLPVPVLVGSYDQIRHDGIDRIPSGTFDLVVLDEAQRIKDRDSATSLACRLLPRTRSWALSATPLENNLEDIATILGFLDPNFGPHPTNRSVTRKLEQSMLRRRKHEVRSELPPVIVQDMKLELTPEQRLQYDALWATRASYIVDRDGDEGAAMLGLITRLKGICNYDEVSGTSAKLAALETLVDSAGVTARILVFSQFVQTLDWLAKRLSVQQEMIIGAMDMEARRAAMGRFRTEKTPRALLISLRAGGVGLNLGEATHVVLFDRWWNPAVENQAIFRAHRFDRPAPLHVVRLLVHDSIEERIATILDEKAELFDDVVEGAKSSSRGFRQAELATILGLSGYNGAT